MSVDDNPTKKPRVILGLLTFGPPGSEFYGSRITSLDDFNACLDDYQANGYREVDTARQYVKGQQEGFTKAAQWRERQLVLATKCYPEQPGWHREAKLKEILGTSLRNLGTDQVDIFYLHAPDRSVPYEETLQACDDLYRAGKFKQLGLSNYAAWEVAEIWNIANQKGFVKPSVYQAMYNAITRAIEDELVPCCRKYGIDIVAYNPLAGGVLSGKYKSKTVPVDGRFAQTDPRIGEMYRERYFKDTNFEALSLIEPVAAAHHLSLLEIAFRWLVHHSKLKVIDDGHDGIVIGVSSRDQLRSNLADLEKGPLPEAVLEVLDRAWLITKATCPLYWR
ncbi:uncharacterized protein PV07_05732 [Cladophialophora immunda]|uniref:NADP-dependent oxidoreductase domain-containing protein n=1 Tax=Cladophialophora immunda TaxID=569365 RepID=A0A0D2CFR1_9EURO|nr:uncharacterized protein PV07_05732 [Cladophialophora immunda]KIW29948.1 hypothetical protein PV07_05732 [Cladophialophora immunda]OQV07274.1 hypothetical protein CLAIMM_11729 [Cladophialophora immunda]